MKQLSDFTEQVQRAAHEYVQAYEKDNTFRGFHLTVMRQFDLLFPQLAECIDVLLWQRDQQVLETIADFDAWHADHEYWAATY